MNLELIESIPVTIEQIDKTATPFPTGISGRKFPVNNVVRKSQIVIQAQVVFGDRDQDGNFTPMGASEQVKGYMVISLGDLKDAGIKLERGDKIIKIEDGDEELYITHSSGDRSAHIGGKFGLARIPFQDRQVPGTKST